MFCLYFIDFCICYFCLPRALSQFLLIRRAIKHFTYTKHQYKDRCSSTPFWSITVCSPVAFLRAALLFNSIPKNQSEKYLLFNRFFALHFISANFVTQK